EEQLLRDEAGLQRLQTVLDTNIVVRTSGELRSGCRRDFRVGACTEGTSHSVVDRAADAFRFRGRIVPFGGWDRGRAVIGARAVRAVSERAVTCLPGSPSTEVVTLLVIHFLGVEIVSEGKTLDGVDQVADGVREGK